MALEADDINVSRMIDWPHVVLGGLPVVCATMDKSADGFVEQALRARGQNERPFYSTSANGQVLALCVRNRGFMDLMLQAGQIHADGMPMVHYSKLLCDMALPERVATTDLVHAVAARAQDAGATFYFLGGSEEVNAKAVAAMTKLYPRLRFAGRRNGYFKPEEEEAIVADIREKRPDILWVGLGFPYEQQFISRNLDNLRGIGVVKTSGGLFDFLSGKNPRAPMWMQRRGLEWAYRMYNEPRRLTLRYLLTNPVAVYALLRYSR
ncbi:WecB/TagA/CpsF family glycosyltransferase [Neorhizobium sp. NCHU2750]|uniref:WecB/TagA/CpsF family glycosyltransferase n=1 Tax=Neorhizobium sp. NCHU2750 TaxID=1825976 RepID=UPI001FE0659F